MNVTLSKIDAARPLRFGAGVAAGGGCSGGTVGGGGVGRMGRIGCVGSSSLGESARQVGT